MLRAWQIVMLALLLTAAVRTNLCAQSTPSLEQRLAQAFDYDDPKGSESRLLALSSEAQAAGDIVFLAEILTQVARAQTLQGHVEEAAHTLDRAEALHANAARPRVRLLIERGRLLRRQGRPQDARPNFEKAYEAALAADQAALAVDAAHMLALMLPFEEARTWMDRGLVLAERSSDSTMRHWVGVITNNWGWQLDERGDHQGAALAFARALAARRLENDPAVSRESEFALAVQLRKLGLAGQALAIQERLEQETKAAKEPVGEILIEKVENLRALNRKDEARRVAEEALRSLSSEGAPTEQIDRLQTMLKEMSDKMPGSANPLHP